MEDYLIVDGYNIMNGWPELAALKEQSLEHARDKLVEIMGNFQALMGNRVVVVFDAHLVKGSAGNREHVGGVEVIFSREGETADSVIERLVGQLPPEAVVSVATSDWAEQRVVMGKGALRLSARELYRMVQLVTAEAKENAGKRGRERRPLDMHLTERMRETLEHWRRGK